VSRALLVLAAMLALTATGCTVPSPTTTDGAATVTPTATPTATTISTPAIPERPYATTTPKLKLTARTTKPGATLEFGEQAVVPYYGPYAKGLLGVTVTVRTVKATATEIAKLPLKEKDKAQLRGNMFVFVRQRLVNVDGTNLGDMSQPVLSPTTASGGLPGAVIMIGLGRSVTGCESTVPPMNFSTKGAAFADCQLHFASPSDPVTSVEYRGAPYDGARGSVTWRAP
jgi:hypothetical protein